MKTVDGDASKWYKAVPAVFWAERITIQKSTGYSPYYLAHGVVAPPIGLLGDFVSIANGGTV